MSSGSRRMTCFGRNHSFNCSCGFGAKGDSSASQSEDLPSFAGSGAGSHCNKCGAIVFFRRVPSGGGTFFDRLGGNWPRHLCSDQRYKYTPFNRHNRPKLRNRKSDLQRRGFLPIVIVNLVCHSGRSVLTGTWLNTPSRFSLTISDLVSIDAEKPASLKAGINGQAVLSFFAVEAERSSELIVQWTPEEA